MPLSAAAAVWADAVWDTTYEPGNRWSWNVGGFHYVGQNYPLAFVFTVVVFQPDGGDTPTGFLERTLGNLEPLTLHTSVDSTGDGLGLNSSGGAVFRTHLFSYSWNGTGVFLDPAIGGMNLYFDGLGATQTYRLSELNRDGTTLVHEERIHIGGTMVEAYDPDTFPEVQYQALVGDISIQSGTGGQQGDGSVTIGIPIGPTGEGVPAWQTSLVVEPALAAVERPQPIPAAPYVYDDLSGSIPDGGSMSAVSYTVPDAVWNVMPPRQWRAAVNLTSLSAEGRLELHMQDTTGVWRAVFEFSLSPLLVNANLSEITVGTAYDIPQSGLCRLVARTGSGDVSFTGFTFAWPDCRVSLQGSGSGGATVFGAEQYDTWGPPVSTSSIGPRTIGPGTSTDELIAVTPPDGATAIEIAYINNPASGGGIGFDVALYTSDIPGAGAGTSNGGTFIPTETGGPSTEEQILDLPMFAPPNQYLHQRYTTPAPGAGIGTGTFSQTMAIYNGPQSSDPRLDFPKTMLVGDSSFGGSRVVLPPKTRRVRAHFVSDNPGAQTYVWNAASVTVPAGIGSTSTPFSLTIASRVFATYSLVGPGQWRFRRSATWVDVDGDPSYSSHLDIQIQNSVGTWVSVDSPATMRAAPDRFETLSVPFSQTISARIINNAGGGPYTYHGLTWSLTAIEDATVGIDIFENPTSEIVTATGTRVPGVREARSISIQQFAYGDDFTVDLGSLLYSDSYFPEPADFSGFTLWAKPLNDAAYMLSDGIHISVSYEVYAETTWLACYRQRPSFDRYDPATDTIAGFVWGPEGRAQQFVVDPTPPPNFLTNVGMENAVPYTPISWDTYSFTPTDRIPYTRSFIQFNRVGLGSMPSGSSQQRYDVNTNWLIVAFSYAATPFEYVADLLTAGEAQGGFSARPREEGIGTEWAAFALPVGFGDAETNDGSISVSALATPYQITTDPDTAERSVVRTPIVYAMREGSNILYVSDTRGSSWREGVPGSGIAGLPIAGLPDGIAPNPAPQISSAGFYARGDGQVYAVNVQYDRRYDGIWRSGDDGVSWRRIVPFDLGPPELDPLAPTFRGYGGGYLAFGPTKMFWAQRIASTQLQPDAVPPYEDTWVFKRADPNGSRQQTWLQVTLSGGPFPAVATLPNYFILRAVTDDFVLAVNHDYHAGAGVQGVVWRIDAPVIAPDSPPNVQDIRPAAGDTSHLRTPWDILPLTETTWIAAGPSTFGAGTFGQLDVWRTEDAGVTWSQYFGIPAAQGFVNGVPGRFNMLASPNLDPNEIYILGNAAPDVQQIVWQSNDRGVTFHRLRNTADPLADGAYLVQRPGTLVSVCIPGAAGALAITGSFGAVLG